MAKPNVSGMFKRFFEAGSQVDSSTSARTGSASVESKLASGVADFMLVTCIDYRYAHVVHNFVREEYPGKLYDQLVLAGASLAADEARTGKSDWKQTFVDHIVFAITHHHINRVLILDHRTCGAYREFRVLTEAQEGTPLEEERHDEVATGVADLIIDLFRANKKQGSVLAFLTPKVTDPAADDFPSMPQFLCERTT